jgi:small subunit ribosomal protein S16
MDGRSARDSRAIENLGHYNPRTDPVEFVVDVEKVKKWLAQGASPSDTVSRLLQNAGIIPKVERKAVPAANKAVPAAK